MYYINIFFVFSVLGHIIEGFTYAKIDGGILYGFWTPVYGLGVLVIVIVNIFISRLKLNKWLKVLLLFLMSSVILALLELVGGYFIEFVFGRVFWNYQSHFVPIGKYTSLQMMGVWGTISIALVYLIIPHIEGLIRKIPKWITYALLIVFLVDLVYTFVRLSDFKFW